MDSLYAVLSYLMQVVTTLLKSKNLLQFMQGEVLCV